MVALFLPGDGCRKRISELILNESSYNLILVNDRRHIVIASPGCGSTGSVANVAVKQAQELSKHFDRVTLVSDGFLSDLDGKIQKGLVSPRQFGYLRRFCHVPNEYSFVRSVRRYLEILHQEDRISFIICHGHALAGLAAKPLKEKYGIPFAVVTHGDIFTRPKGTYDRRVTAFYKYVTPMAYRNADLVIALSPYMADCAEKGGARHEAVKVIPNGITLEDIGLNAGQPGYSPDRGGRGEIKLLYVGRMEWYKGVLVLMEACRILKEKSVPFVLQLIGSGPLYRKIQRLIERNHLSGMVNSLGEKPRKELGPYYQSADLLIVPSLTEALPTVALEALLAGTPVIGSDVGGIPYIVRSGENGVIINPNDPIALSGAIERFYYNPDGLTSLRNNAFSSVSPRFSWNTTGESIASSIDEVLRTK